MSIASAEEQLRSLTLELQQFVLNRKTNHIRKELYEHMILRIIYDHCNPAESMRREKIPELLKADYSLEKIPLFHLDAAIKSLKKDGSISILKDGTLFLRQEKRTELGNRDQEFNSLRNRVFDDLAKRISKKVQLTDAQIKLVLTNFDKALGQTLSKYGALSAKVLGAGGDISSLRKHDGFEKIIHDIVRNCIPEEHCHEVENEFDNFFFSPSPDLCNYFATKAQSYVLSRILNVDPGMRKIEEADWKKKTVYLDTNLVIALLFKGHRLHKSTHTLIMNTRDLGARIVVSKRTQQEFLSWLQKNSNEHKGLKPEFNVLADAVEHSKTNTFLLTFLKEAEQNRSQTLDRFMLKYHNFHFILKNLYQIEIDETSPPIKNDIEEIKKMKVTIWETRPTKEEPVADHDAYHIFLVHQKRAEVLQDGIGPNIWFLTVDNSLNEVELKYYGPKELPASVTTNAWMGVISPFLSPSIASNEDFTDAFTRLIGTNLFPKKIDSGNITELLALFYDERIFTIEQIRQVMGNEFFKQCIEEAKTAAEEGDEDLVMKKLKPAVDLLREMYDTNLQKSRELLAADAAQNNQKLKDELSRAHDAKLVETAEAHDSEMKKMKSEVDGLKRSLNEVTKEKDEKSFKIKILTVIIIITAMSAIADYFIFSIFFSTYGFTLLTIIAVQAGVILGLPKFIEFFRHQKSHSVEPSSS